MKFLIKGFMYIPEKYFTNEIRRKLTIENPQLAKRIQNNQSIEGIEERFIIYKKMRDKNNAIVYQVPRYTFGNFNNRDYNVVLKDVPISINIKKKLVDNKGKPIILN